MFQYYDKVVEGQTALTIQQLEGIETVLSMGTELNESLKDSRNLVFVRPKDKPEDKLDEALRRARTFLDSNETVLDEEEKEMEERLAKLFFELPRSIRDNIQERIPLQILRRLKNAHEDRDKNGSASEEFIHERK